MAFNAIRQGGYDMNNSESSILEMDREIHKIMEDIRSRVRRVYDSYTDENREIPKLPDYDLMLKNNRLRYNTSKTLTESLDELIRLKLRVSIVERNISSMRNIQITNKSDFTLISTLKSNLKKYESELQEYKFEISDLMKNANNKLRVLESVSFYNE